VRESSCEMQAGICLRELMVGILSWKDCDVIGNFLDFIAFN